LSIKLFTEVASIIFLTLSKMDHSATVAALFSNYSVDYFREECNLEKQNR
jgi:hypothetical protein